MGLQRVRRITNMLLGAMIESGCGAGALVAQSAADRAAWNAMMLSPLGALTPLARDPIDDETRQADVWLRYGRWRYDVDDAIHNTVGVTVFRAIPFPLESTELS